MLGLSFCVLVLIYQVFLAVATQISLIKYYSCFWDIKEQKLKRCVNMVCFCKTKETNGETKTVKVKDCIWHSKFDNWVNRMWFKSEWDQEWLENF